MLLSCFSGVPAGTSVYPYKLYILISIISICNLTFWPEGDRIKGDGSFRSLTLVLSAQGPKGTVPFGSSSVPSGHELIIRGFSVRIGA